MPKVRIKATTKVKKKPVKAGSQQQHNKGGIFNAKVIAIVKKAKGKKNG